MLVAAGLEALPETQRRFAVAMLLADEPIVVEFERAGVQWRVDMGDEIGWSLYATGGYETDEIAAVLDWLSPTSGTIVDAGANVGTTSIPLALAGYDVIAVEPVPTTYKMLTTNVGRNHLGHRIDCVQCAVVAEAGQVEMWVGLGSGMSEVAVSGREPAMTRVAGKGELVAVEGRRLEDIAPADTVLVWADVQGLETQLLRSGASLWRTGVPVYLEVDPHSLELHGGLVAFVEVATEFFGGFIPNEEIGGGARPRPIAELGAWAQSIAGHFSDALLVQ